MDKKGLSLRGWRRYNWLRPQCVELEPTIIRADSQEELYEKMWEILEEQMVLEELACTFFSFITKKYEASGAEPGSYSLPHGTEDFSFEQIKERIQRNLDYYKEEYTAVRMRFEFRQRTDEMMRKWFIIVLN